MTSAPRWKSGRRVQGRAPALREKGDGTWTRASLRGPSASRTGRGLRLVLATSLAAALGLAALRGAAARAAGRGLPGDPSSTTRAPRSDARRRSRERIISLSPANTEIVFALGAGDRLVGGTDFDDYPAEAVALPDVATYQGVVMEQVVDLEPDLVLAGWQRLHAARRHRAHARAGLSRSSSSTRPTCPTVLADIELIGAGHRRRRRRPRR